MKIRRRRLLQFGAAAIAASATSRFGWAQTYPTRPVRIIVGFAVGGVTRDGPMVGGAARPAILR